MNRTNELENQQDQSMGVIEAIIGVATILVTWVAIIQSFQTSNYRDK